MVVREQAIMEANALDGNKVPNDIVPREMTPFAGDKEDQLLNSAEAVHQQP